MRSWAGTLNVVALAGVVGACTGCGSSTRAPAADGGGNLDVAVGSGSTAGAGGAMASGGAIGAGGTTTLGSGGRGGAASSGGTATGGIGVDASTDATGPAGIDATGVDPKQLCEMWRTRSPAQDTLDLQQYALFTAGTVLEGKLAGYVNSDSGDASYAILAVDRVWAGISQYAGLASKSAIRMDRALYDQLGDGAQVIAGFSQTHPQLDSGSALPLWEQPQALLAKSSQVAAELLGFHVWKTPNVAVARVEELLDGGVRLALVESLRGTLPSSFQFPFSDTWPSLDLKVGSTWVGGFSETLQTPAGGTPSVSLLELRPDTQEERAAVKTALGTLEPAGFATRYQAGLGQAKADASRLRLGWLYNQADLVAAIEVAGIGNECCTGAGGIFHAGSVVELLHGQAPAGQVLTGGHGYRVQKKCGDRFLYAFGPSVVLADGLAVDCEGKVSVPAGPASDVLHELAATADSLASARQWVGSAPPLLRLYPGTSTPPAAAFAQATGIALWSTPVAALTAIMAGTPAVFTITSVSEQPEGVVVRMRSPFYVLELSHLIQRDLALAFACADPRLLQVGARLIGVVVGTEVLRVDAVPASLEQGHLFLVPGLLLPERSDLIRALGQVPSAVAN